MAAFPDSTTTNDASTGTDGSVVIRVEIRNEQVRCSVSVRVASGDTEQMSLVFDTFPDAHPLQSHD